MTANFISKRTFREEYQDVEIPEGYVVCTSCKGKGNTTKYEQGWRSLVYDPELDAPTPCIVCGGEGFRKRLAEGAMIPWYYRLRLVNWLMAKPWRWHYRTIYLYFRTEHSRPTTTTRPLSTNRFNQPPYGRLRAAWLALTFPHVHHESEE